MTDMRATDRLLEVIEEHATTLDGDPTEETDEILKAVRELRRRGDTLVRADDLRLVVEYMGDPFSGGSVRAESELGEARDRLNNALGGRIT